jgi:hypothetical protein
MRIVTTPMSESQPPPRQRPTLIQVCLMVLPFGTVVLGGIAMLLYFQRDRPDGREDTNSPYSREPTAASIADYVRKLSGPMTGRRSVQDENGRRGLLAAMSLIEGALGETNMGYKPASQSFDAAGFSWKNIWADNPGQRNPTEVIEVRAAYDKISNPAMPARDSLPVAVGLELAQAFTGTTQRRTIRFLFLGHQTPATPGAQTGGQAYATLMQDRRVKVMAVIDLNGADLDAARCVSTDGTLDHEAIMETVARLRTSITRVANQ